jgi:hypothetical protein
MSKRKAEVDLKQQVKSEPGVQEKKAKSARPKSQLDLVVRVKKVQPNIVTLSELLLETELEENPVKKTHPNRYVDIIQKCNVFVSMLGCDIEQASMSRLRLDLAEELRANSGKFLVEEEKRLKGMKPTSDFHACCVARNSLKRMMDLYKQAMS